MRVPFPHVRVTSSFSKQITIIAGHETVLQQVDVKGL
jgi:hypothetical protein